MVSDWCTRPPPKPASCRYVIYWSWLTFILFESLLHLTHSRNGVLCVGTKKRKSYKALLFDQLGQSGCAFCNWRLLETGWNTWRENIVFTGRVWGWSSLTRGDSLVIQYKLKCGQAKSCDGEPVYGFLVSIDSWPPPTSTDTFVAGRCRLIKVGFKHLPKQIISRIKEIPVRQPPGEIYCQYWQPEKRFRFIYRQIEDHTVYVLSPTVSPHLPEHTIISFKQRC